jgi:hypothetical protein
MNDMMREDLLALVTNKESWNRRGLCRQFDCCRIRTGSAAGVRAERWCVTDTSGLEEGDVQIPTDNGNIPAYYAKPYRVINQQPADTGGAGNLRCT